MTDAVAPGAVVGFIGLGKMGLPMVARLTGAGFRVHAADLSAEARAAAAQAGASVFERAAEAALGAAVLITMLPDGKVVRRVLLEGGVADALADGALVIDMSSSAAMETRVLQEALAGRGLRLIDAPVSGGVRRAADGSLTIMVGGDPDALEEAHPVLAAMGKTITHTGPIGSGHAMKALNNYVSAAGLAAACEALIAGQAYGMDPVVMVDVLNASTGRNNSTEVKLKPFIISGSFASGFSLALMAKDIRTAADLAHALGTSAVGADEQTRLWADALDALGEGADHPEIYRYLNGEGAGGKTGTAS